jgi:hypothetical protein
MTRLSLHCSWLSLYQVYLSRNGVVAVKYFADTLTTADIKTIERLSPDVSNLSMNRLYPHYSLYTGYMLIYPASSTMRHIRTTLYVNRYTQSDWVAMLQAFCDGTIRPLPAVFRQPIWANVIIALTVCLPACSADVKREYIHSIFEATERRCGQREREILHSCNSAFTFSWQCHKHSPSQLSRLLRPIGKKMKKNTSSIVTSLHIFNFYSS